MDDMNGVYPHLLVQLLAVVLGWMDPEADFKLNISPRLESILVAIILQITSLLYNILLVIRHQLIIIIIMLKH